MKLKLSILCLLCNYILIGQQISDLDLAKQIALAEDKLIIVRYCYGSGPTQWNTYEFEKLYDRFVLVNIDAIGREVSLKHRVENTGRVFVQTINDDILIEDFGSMKALYILHVLQAFPSDYEELNNKLLASMNEEATPDNFYELAEAYRKLGLDTDEKTVKNAFLSKSKMYYKKAANAAESAALQQMSDLSQLRIDAYLGKTQRVKRKLRNYPFDPLSVNAVELIDFIKAYCFKNEGEVTQVNRIKDKIKNPELLRELK